MSSLLSASESILAMAGYRKSETGIFKSGNSGYWSNLDKQENKDFIELLQNTTPLAAVRKMIPQQEDHIFSPKREAALELLNINEGIVCIDYGCMWGVLSVGLAKRGATVVAIDQTEESLEFLNARKKHESLDSIIIVQDDVRKVKLKNFADYAIVNGVLEWIPESGDIEIKKFFGKRNSRGQQSVNPQEIQLNFLKQVRDNLKDNGELLLAIENRYDYTQFIGKKDPHANLFLTSFLPRYLSNLISMLVLGRPYVNYLYSFQGLKDIIIQAGFKEVNLYATFPHYHMPELILPYQNGISKYRKYYSIRGSSWKRKIVNLIEYFLMKYFKGKFFSPAILVVAKK
jgi:SAM-dependent methyltransferase